MFLVLHRLVVIKVFPQVVGGHDVGELAAQLGLAQPLLVPALALHTLQCDLLLVVDHQVTVQRL